MEGLGRLMGAIKRYKFSKKTMVKNSDGDYVKLSDLLEAIESKLQVNYHYKGHKIITKKDLDDIIQGPPPKEHYPWQD